MTSRRPQHELDLDRLVGEHDRLDALASGQQRALDRLLRSVAEKPRRAIDVFGALFARSVGEDNVPLLGMATGEAIACLNHLLELGKATRESDAQGVDWYRAAAGG